MRITQRIAVPAALLALPLLCCPTLAQADAAPPAGWSVAQKPNGARVFSPPGLAAGEIYSVTIYKGAKLEGKALDTYLRAFAGPVGEAPGQLLAPLAITLDESRGAWGTGSYAAPGGASLSVLFIGVASREGRSIHVSRTLFSGDAMLARYQSQTQALLGAQVQKAKQSTDAAPPVAKRASESDDAGKKPYAWVTAPGKGVSMAQIEAVVQDYSFSISPGVSVAPGVMGIDSHERDDVYLLLKNGLVHKGLPVPPDQFDVARSRRAEPKSWGRWRREAGKYLVAWDGAPFEPLPGSRVRPGVAGTQLQGHYGTGSASTWGLGTSYTLRGVTFTKGGRFRKESRGGSMSSVGIGDGATSASSTYGDDGSSTTASGAGFGVAAGRKNGADASREGTYSISGYTMMLRYKNGKVERLPFFFCGADRNSVWFEGSTLTGGTE